MDRYFLFIINFCCLTRTMFRWLLLSNLIQKMIEDCLLVLLFGDLVTVKIVGIKRAEGRNCYTCKPKSHRGYPDNCRRTVNSGCIISAVSIMLTGIVSCKDTVNTKTDLSTFTHYKTSNPENRHETKFIKCPRG